MSLDEVILELQDSCGMIEEGGRLWREQVQRSWGRGGAALGLQHWERGWRGAVMGRGWGGRKDLDQVGLWDLVRSELFFPFLLSHFLPPSGPLFLPPSLPSFPFFPSCLFPQALGQGLGPVSFFRLLPLRPSPLLSPPPPLPNCCPAPTGPVLPPTPPLAPRPTPPFPLTMRTRALSPALPSLVPLRNP